VRFDGGSSARGTRWQNRGTIARRTCGGRRWKDIVDLGHPLVRPARDIDWRVLDGCFAGVLLNSVEELFAALKK
jgi:hypothetical protein